jgi:hypothetical protein
LTSQPNRLAVGLVGAHQVAASHAGRGDVPPRSVRGRRLGQVEDPLPREQRSTLVIESVARLAEAEERGAGHGRIVEADDAAEAEGRIAEVAAAQRRIPVGQQSQRLIA